MNDDRKPIIRHLSGTERIFLAGRLPAICVIELEGSLRADILEEALDALATEHPILRSRVVEDDAGGTLELLARRPELIVRTHPGDPALLEVNTRLHPGECNARFTLYLQDRRCALAIVLSHAFSDGLLLSTLSRKLLTYYAARVRGERLAPVARETFDLPLDTRLPSEQELVSFARPATPPRMLPTRVRAESESGAGVHTVRFDRTETDGIYVSAMRALLPPLGLITGAAAAALAEEGVGGRDQVAIWCLLDLRSRLNPPVAADAGIFCAAPVVLTLSLADSLGSVDLGRQAVAQLQDAMAERIPERMVHTLARVRPDEHPRCSLTISNLGRYVPPALPEGLRVLAHRGFVVSDAPAPTVIIITTEGKLCIDVTYDRARFSHASIVRWGDRLRALLLAGSDGARRMMQR